MIEGQELADRLKRNRDLQFYNNQLVHAEKQINTGFSQMVNALKDIENNELWKWTPDNQYLSMDDYCMKKWGIGLRRRQQLQHAESFKAALCDEVSDEARPMVESLREGHIRAIEALPEASRVEVVEAVIKKAPKRITADEFKKVAAEIGVVPASALLPKKEKIAQVKPVCPHCGVTL